MASDSKDVTDFTGALRLLSTTGNASEDVFEEVGGAALLLCRDGDAKKWGSRWLGQSGLQVTVAADPANGLEVARSIQPDVIVVEGALSDGSGQAVYEVLQEAADVSAELIVLCANNNQLKAALAGKVFDTERKPYNWQSVAARAYHALQIRNRSKSLAETKTALKDALDLANSAREQLRTNQRFEPVTGLPNKTKFAELLRRGMAATDKNGGSLAVFVVGFTRFRLVVEAMGQEQADKVLAEIGRRMAACVGDADAMLEHAPQGLRTAAIGILDSHRFGLMITVHNDEALPPFQQRLLETLSKPIQAMGQVVHLSACLGIATYPQDAEDVDQLLQRADNAMRDAQSRGGGCKYYCADTDRAAARKLRIEHMLHEALDREELSVAYQPILDVATGRTVALEALLRWRHADGSFTSPVEFIPVAEESGLMLRTGEYVLERACQQFAAWQRSGFQLSQICVNASSVQLMSSSFAGTVKRVVAKSGLKPSELEIEISERGVLSGDSEVLLQLQQLKSLGINLSIDDFGTGDSAIAYLKELPVDVLKIDRSYISGLGTDGKDAALASAMVALGQRLDLTVIAEGIETAEQLKVLRALGCDRFQGFFAAKPMLVDVATQFLQRNCKS